MSIVNEALKKASKEVGKGEGWLSGSWTLTETKRSSENSGQRAVERVVPSEKKHRSFRSRVLLGIFIAVAASLGAFLYVVSKAQLPTPVTQQTVLNTAPLPSVSEVKEEVLPVIDPPASIPQTSPLNRPLRSLKKIPPLELSGIMMNDPPQALINGRFIEEGRMIDGVRVLKIVANHVTFKYKKRKFKRWLE